MRASWLVPWLLLLSGMAAAQAPAKPAGGAAHPSAAKTYPADLVQAGAALFQQNCSFCHGRDAGGGETGPDLKSSKLVSEDVNGERIGPVVLHGRTDKGMPPFPLSPQQINSLVAFIHTAKNKSVTRRGGRKSVEVADLQTGNVEAGRQYFNGPGGCSSCHSPTGDLAGVASRFEGLKLEEQMLYPKNAKSKVTVTLPSGESITGVLEYLDEFTVGLVKPDGVYRSWRTKDVKYTVDEPVKAHVELFGKYSDADIHNLMAYLQTLR